jgi:hypothetical protein
MVIGVIILGVICYKGVNAIIAHKRRRDLDMILKSKVDELPELEEEQSDVGFTGGKIEEDVSKIVDDRSDKKYVVDDETMKKIENECSSKQVKKVKIDPKAVKESKGGKNKSVIKRDAKGRFVKK